MTQAPSDDGRAKRDAAMDAYLSAGGEEPQEQTPRTPAGWYVFPEMANTVRYWDGARWTEHYGPASVAPAPPTVAAAPAAPRREPSTKEAAGAKVACPYCGEAIAVQSTRCSHCSGQRMHCSRCKALRGVSERQKFVGMARGGKQTVHNCLVCGKQLTGPRM